MKGATKAKLKALRNYVDGDADTPYEYFMLLVIIVNTISIGIETSQNISESFRTVLFWSDQVCLLIFILELLFKAVVYNREFFGERRVGDDGKEYFHINRWNISDLIIILISGFSSLPYYSVFRVFRIFRSFKVIKAVRSFRIVKSFKLVNNVSSLRSTFKGLIKAVPGIIWTFCFLALFTYVYAIIGTNSFRDEFPEFFGNLGNSFLTLCQIITFDSWISVIVRQLLEKYPWAWVYFISYGFIAASVIMNVLVGIIVDSMGKEREIQKEKELKIKKDKKITLEKISAQLAEINERLEKLERQ